MAQVPIDAAELLAMIEVRAEARNRERQDAIACFLSGSDGWRDALALLGGAFAPEAAAERPKDD